MPGRRRPPPVKSEGYDAGFHVGISPNDPEVIRIQFFEPPGIEMSAGDAEGGREALHARRAAPRRRDGGRQRISYPARVRESYASDLLAARSTSRRSARGGFRIVVDYGFSAASYVLPLVLGPLGVEVVAAHAFPSEGDGGDRAPGSRRRSARRSGSSRRSARDLGAVFDRAGERLYLVDEQAREVPVEQALLLFLRLIGSNGRRGKLAFPVTVTSQVDRLIEGSPLEIVRTPASLPALTQAAAEEGVVFAGAVGGGYVFPEFLPGYDAVASLAKLLELLAPVERPLSELVAELPQLDARPPPARRARGR